MTRLTVSVNALTGIKRSREALTRPEEAMLCGLQSCSSRLACGGHLAGVSAACKDKALLDAYHGRTLSESLEGNMTWHNACGTTVEKGRHKNIETTYRIMDVPCEECLHRLSFESGAGSTSSGGEASSSTVAHEELLSAPASGTILGLLLELVVEEEPEELGEIQSEIQVEQAAGIRTTRYTVYSFGDVT
jgi:hypothetical protein